MLNTILLALSEAVQKSEIEAFCKEVIDTYEGTGLSFRLIEKAEQLYKYKQEDSILITDMPDFFHEAYKYQMAGVAYFHDMNKLRTFTEASYGITTLYDIEYSYLERVYKRFYKIPWEILKTKRCLIREMTMDDLDALYEVYGDKSITQYMESLYEDREKERDYMEKYIANMYGFYGFGMWIVERLDDGEVIGRAGLGVREDYDDVELGYVIRKDEQQKGYAFEVCQGIMEYAKKELEVKRMNAFVHPGNKVSAHLCERLGFKKCGTASVDEETLDFYVWRKELEHKN